MSAEPLLYGVVLWFWGIINNDEKISSNYTLSRDDDGRV